MDILNDINIILTNFINDYRVLGLILCCLLIFIEAILPFLPLSVFVTIIYLMYGKLIGFLVSFLFSVLGTLFLFQMLTKIKLKKKKEYLNKFNNISLFNLALLYALPFNSTFLMTLMCSLSKINVKKFTLGLIMGKFFEVYFWGFVGCSLFDSLTNIKCLVKVILGLTIMYVVTYIIKKKYKF